MTVTRPARRLRHTVGSLLLATALLAACAGGSEERDTDQPDDEVGAETSSEDEDAGEAETRTVTTVAGEVEVPVDPQRIVTTHNIATQPLIDLGVEPVGVGDLAEEAAYPEYWEQIDGIPQVGTGLEVDLELIASLEPDVIFAINAMEQGGLDQLTEIAPVVVVGIAGPQRADWRGRAELIAEVTGREAELSALGDQFADRAAQIAGDHADTLGQETFVVLDAFEPGSVVPYGPTSMVGEVLVPAGVEFAPSADSELVRAVDESPDEALSLEQLPEVADGSVILHGAPAGSTEPNPAQQGVLDSPLLRSSAAAEAGQVYPIGKTLIAGYGDVFACLDLLEAALEDLSS